MRFAPPGVDFGGAAPAAAAKRADAPSKTAAPSAGEGKRAKAKAAKAERQDTPKAPAAVRTAPPSDLWALFDRGIIVWGVAFVAVGPIRFGLVVCVSSPPR